MSALIFDCDGVLSDTEREGHLPAFNQTFREFGLPVQWSEEEYGRRLRIGGGKERMASLLTEEFIAAAGLPRERDGATRRSRALAQAQDGDLHRHGGRRPPAAAGPASPA